MNMKKMYRRLFLLLLCVMFALTACHTDTGNTFIENEAKEKEDNSKSELQENEDEYSGGESEKAEEPDSTEKPDEVAPTGDFGYKLSSVVKAMAITEKGYYYIAHNIMCFYDIANDISIPMCSRTDCSHGTSGCDAYADNTTTKDTSCICDGYVIFYYNDMLYMVERGGTSECDYFLYRYDSSFNNKELVIQLSQYGEEKILTANQGSYTIFDGYLYYYTYKHDPYASAKGNYMTKLNCMRVKLKKGETPEILGTFDYAGDHKDTTSESLGAMVLTDGEDVYYVAGHYTRYFTKQNEMEYRVARYSINEDEFEILASYMGERNPNAWGENIGQIVCKNESVCMAEDGTMYAITDSGIAAINFETGVRKKIYSTPYDFNSKYLYEWELQDLAYDGTYLYFIEQNMYKNVYLTAIDKEGNLINRYQFEYTDELLELFTKYNNTSYPTEYIRLLGVADGNILVESRENAYKNLSGRGSFASATGNVCAVGMINTVDFLGNKDIEIKQIYKY